MSIVAYTGLQGSGKTYEVVAEVVVSGVKAARRIVTNIQGLQADAIAAYVLKRWKEKVQPDIVVVKNSDIESPEFFYYEREGPDHTPVKSKGTLCHAGDLVIVDEAWRFWGTDSKISETHQIFFREHRHYTDGAGVSSDLVLISQSINDFHPRLKRVIERTFRTRKLKELGLRKGYTVFQHERASERQSTVLQKWVKRYSEEIFALYSSYSAGQGAELAVDRRESFFGSAKIWWRGALVLAVLLGGVWGVRNFFKAPDEALPVEAAKTKGGKDGKSNTVADVNRAPDAGSTAGAGSLAGGPTPLSGTSMDWQQVGFVQRGDALLVLVRSSDGRYRYMREPDYRMEGRELTVMIDGKPVTTWSGTVRAVSAAATGARK